MTEAEFFLVTQPGKYCGKLVVVLGRTPSRTKIAILSNRLSGVPIWVKNGVMEGAKPRDATMNRYDGPSHPHFHPEYYLIRQPGHNLDRRIVMVVERTLTEVRLIEQGHQIFGHGHWCSATILDSAERFPD